MPNEIYNPSASPPAPVTPEETPTVPTETPFSYTSEAEGDGVRVYAQRGSWTANTLARTEAEGRKTLREAYKVFHPDPFL